MIQVPEVKLQFMNQAYYETFIGFFFFLPKQKLRHRDKKNY